MISLNCENLFVSIVLTFIKKLYVFKAQETNNCQMM